MMILRVWAMYYRSKLILCVILTLFSLEVIASIVGAAMNSYPKNVSSKYMTAKK